MGDNHLGQNFNASKEQKKTTRKKTQSVSEINRSSLGLLKKLFSKETKKDRLEEKLSNGIERYGSLAVLTFLTQLWANLEMTVQAANKLQLMTVGKL